MIDLRRTAPQISASSASRRIEADAVEISPGLYSILIGGRSFQVHVAERGAALLARVGHYEFIVELADPRAWRRGRGSTLEAEGQQEIIAPMPGKIVRVLAAKGSKVEAGQGILVVEAMKMQNELRSPKSGTLEKLLVTEGQAVNSGDVLAVIV
ncbi:MAG TPA: biotin/lipoyl-containing protein [Candidatus Acidoferrales bacterium]|nr:biotin/lipoyl-containing protein [Candidatus Acidoferrales bacterium]